ncbi:L,D-transpeptidase [Elusimicrobiota bacterium]
MRNSKWIIIAVLSALPFSCFAQCPAPLAKQVLVSLTDSWNSAHGKAQLFERNKDNQWVSITKPLDTIIGRNGMGWGIGLHEDIEGRYVKKEGDGRSPAGIFRLLDSFGTNPSSRVETLLTYHQTDKQSRCVDDVNSAYYNSVIYDKREVEKDWKSFEKLKIAAYEYAVVVDHNRVNSNAKPGHGSCIFLHVKSKKGKPTSGCTAFALTDMQELISILNSEKNPVLVQLPRSQYLSVQGSWCLPILK